MLSTILTDSTLLEGSLVPRAWAILATRGRNALCDGAFERGPTIGFRNRLRIAFIDVTDSRNGGRVIGSARRANSLTALFVVGVVPATRRSSIDLAGSLSPF